MIQILAVTPDSAAIPGLPGLSAGDKATASFTAMMAEAIMMAKSAGPGLAVTATPSGLAGQPAAPVVASATAETGAGTAEAVLASLLAGGKSALPATVPADSGEAEPEGKAPATTAAADPAVPAQPVIDPAAVPLMPGLADPSVAVAPATAQASPVAAATPAVPAAPAVPAMAAAAAPAVPALPAVPAAPAAPAQGMAAASEDMAVAVEAEGRPSGKKLPQPMAVLAARQPAEPLKSGPEAVPAVSGPETGLDSPMTAAETAGDMPVLPTALTATERAPAAPALVVAPAAPTSGHETAAMLEIRHQAAAASPDRVVMGMQSGFGSTAWQQELGDKMVWMAGRQGQMAELVLNPPSLGAVEVRLNLSGGEASAQFFSANPNVRDALEAALPRLREMMGSAGIALGETLVSDQSLSRHDRPGQPGGGQGGAAVADLGEDDLAMASEQRTGLALLDYFA